MSGIADRHLREIDDTLAWLDGQPDPPGMPPGSSHDSGPGESGESGENPRSASNSDGRTRGESGRKRANGGAKLTDDDRTRLMAGARLALARTDYSPGEYPCDALGPLADAARAIAEGGQMAPAMAAQCLLGAASLLVQGLFEVRTLAGIKPLSLYLLTVADSGDGKTTGEDAALSPIAERQRTETARYRQALEDADASRASRRKGDPPPAALPRAPYRIARDSTVEGIRRDFAEGMPSQAAFTSEAAAVLSGYGMTAEHRLKTAATFNALWDAGELSVARGTTGRVQLYGRRLAVHWLIQPDAAREALQDEALASIGFWPRFLLAWPQPAPPRRAIPFRPERDTRIAEYWQRCTVLLDRQPTGEECGGLSVLEPDADALRFLCQFFERMEQSAKREGGTLTGIRPFAIRATEQVCRVAGVLAAFAGRPGIDADTIRDAGRIVAYSLETWRSLFGDRAEADAARHALMLFDWMLGRPDASASETAVLKVGPKALRSRHRRDVALATLEGARLAFRVRDTWHVADDDREAADARS